LRDSLGVWAMRLHWAAAILFSLGCGRLNFDIGDVATADAPCMLGRFGPPQLVPNVNAVGAMLDDWSAAITPDDLSIYFYTFRDPLPPAPDVWVARRTDPNAPFDAPTLMSDVSSVKNDVSPRVSADELTMVFASDRTGTLGLLDIFEATRASKADPFGTAVNLTALNSATDEATLWLSPDGLRIVFSSNRGTSIDLFAAERATRTSEFGVPQIIAGVSTSDAELAPWLTADELEIYFSSLRPSGLGGYDIWHASRSTPTSAWGAVENVSELSSALDDYAPSLSSDGRRLYFNYRTNLLGGADANIYVAERGCL